MTSRLGLLVSTGAPKSEFRIMITPDDGTVTIISPIIVSLGLFSQGVILLDKPNKLKHGEKSLGKYKYFNTMIIDESYGNNVKLIFKPCE